MLRIVRPVSIAAISATNVVAVSAVDIRVADEIVVVIDVDVVVAAPAGAPAPASPPSRSHGDAKAKGDRHASGVVSRRRIINRRVGINRRAVHDHRVIRRHVHDLGICLFDYDHTLALDDLSLHLLLLARFQIAGVLRLFAHALHGIHHIALLRQESVA